MRNRAFLILTLGMASLGACNTRTAIGGFGDDDGGVGDGGIGTGGRAGTGGRVGTDGSVGSGGRIGTGGGVGTGGSVGTGGGVGSGGSVSGGGRIGTGGGAGTGGVVGSGGTVGSGGVVGTGGTVGSGGVVGTGGSVGTGGAAGGVNGGPACGQIGYPATGFYGQNVFYPGSTSFVSRGTQAPQYEIAADVPSGASLIVKMTLLGGSGGASGGRAQNWSLGLDGDWRYTTFNATTGEQTFMSRLAGRNETIIGFQGSGQAQVQFFECGSQSPNRTDMIRWAP